MKRTTAMSVLVFVGLSFFTFDYAIGQTPEPTKWRAKDEQTIQKVPDDFSGAWNRHDMKAYSDLFTEDADVVVINGKHMKGRNEIFTYHDGLHKGAFKERTLTARWKDLRFIGADVAIGHIAFAGRSSSGDERRNTTALATVVLVKQQGRWLIAAFHNTLLSGHHGGRLPSDPEATKDIPTGSPTQTLGPDALVDGFLRAFNAHDAEAFWSLFTEDADWVSVAGIRVKGRADIQAEHEKAFTTFFKSAALASTGTTVRLVRPDVAVVPFTWELTGQVDKEGKIAAPRRGVITIVAAKEDDQWRITAGQNTNTFVLP